jgi:hypothetical protein
LGDFSQNHLVTLLVSNPKRNFYANDERNVTDLNRANKLAITKVKDLLYNFIEEECFFTT